MSSISGSAKGGMFTQAEIDNKALELKLKKAQLKKALDAAKRAADGESSGGTAGSSSSGSGGSAGASANSGSTNLGQATEEQKFQWSRLLQGDRKSVV